MKKQVLLVFDHLEDHIRTRLHDVFDDDKDIECNEERYQGKAQGRFDGPTDSHPDFVIAGMRLAHDKSSKAHENGGLQFFEWLGGRTTSRLALVVQDPPPDIRDRIARIHPRVEVVSYDNLERSVHDFVKTHRRARKYLDVWVAANPTDEWDYVLDGVGFKYHEEGTIRLNHIPNQWEYVSRDLARQSPDWLEKFRHLGEQIIHGILDWNVKFRSQLKVGVDLADGLANTRVTFYVGRGRYQIALEAILAPEFPNAEGFKHGEDPWMVKAPVLRTMALKRPVEQEIFSEDAPLNCLLICADASGPVQGLTNEGRPITLRPLKHIEGECNILETILRQRAKQVPIGKVHRLGKGGDKLDIDTLSATLKERVWDVVHFAGHSYYKNNEKGPGCGYLVLGERGSAQAVEFGDVAAQFRKGKLLYLSSCKSASASFAIDAANAGLPSVVGFRTEVDDEPAKRYAQNFYSRLFNRSSIEKSFFEARKELYSRRDNTWASAMLVMGTAEAA